MAKIARKVTLCYLNKTFKILIVMLVYFLNFCRLVAKYYVQEEKKHVELNN